MNKTNFIGIYPGITGSTLLNYGVLSLKMCREHPKAGLSGKALSKSQQHKVLAQMDTKCFKTFALGHFFPVVCLATSLPPPRKPHIPSTELNILGATAYN